MLEWENTLSKLPKVCGHVKPKVAIQFLDPCRGSSNLEEIVLLKGVTVICVVLVKGLVVAIKLVGELEM